MSTARSRSFVRIVGAASAAIVLMTAGTRAQPYSSYQGSWIWQSAGGPVDTWMCFRKTFSLSSVPSTAVARIAADSRYWLWVNGQQVVFDGGLKRGPNPNDSWCDEVDLAPYLTAGQNYIAAQVWFWGTTSTSYNSSGSGGLYFECPIGGTVVKSDNTWRALVHPAFARTGALPVAVPERPVSFDAGSDIGAWYATSFDDSQWPAATAKGIPPTKPWGALWKRPFPQWKNSGLLDYVNASKLPATSNGGDIQAALPSNIQATAYLKINASAGLKIHIATDHPGAGNYSEYTTKAGVQEWESPAWLNGENVVYSIPSGVQIPSLKYRETGFPAEFAGSFTCNDAFFNSLWTKARRTIYVCMRDNFMDCPDRERAQWLGDATNEFGGGFYSLDLSAHALVKKLFSDLVGWQTSDGRLWGPMPTNSFPSCELPPQTLATISEMGIRAYFLNSGDTATVRSVYPAVKKYLLSVWSMGADGLIVHRNGDWNWFDWGTGCMDEKTMENAWYYSVVKAAIDMANVVGAAGDIAAFQSRKTSIESNFSRICFKGTSFMSPQCSPDGESFQAANLPDDRANGLAVVAGLVADTTLWSGIASVLVSTRQASPYMERYALEGLCAMGRAAEAQARMKTRYTEMVNSMYPTLWEDFDINNGTTNHGWNAGVITVMSGYMAGIGPDSAGYSTYHVLPRMGGLTSIKASVATVKGQVAVSLGKKTDGFAMALASPPATTAIVGIPRVFDNGQSVTSISANNQPVWSAGGSAGSVSGVSLAGADGLFVRFAVTPGRWLFTTGNAPVLDSLPTVVGGKRGEPAINPRTILINGTAVRVAAPAGAQVLISGVDGRTVGRAFVDQGNRSAQFGHLGAGMYLYRVVDKSRRCAGSGRFVLR